MDNHKNIFTHPIQGDCIYTARVWIPRHPPVNSKYYLTVVDAREDLLFCEIFDSWLDTKRRIVEIEAELIVF